MARSRETRYSDDFKREVVAAYLHEKLSGVEASARFGVSVASVHAWARDPRYHPDPVYRMQSPPRRNPNATLVERFNVLESWCQQIGRELGIELEA